MLSQGLIDTHDEVTIRFKENASNSPGYMLFCRRADPSKDLRWMPMCRDKPRHVAIAVSARHKSSHQSLNEREAS